MMQLSGELQAMAAIETALKDLNEDERARVMHWASARFGLAVARPAKRVIEEAPGEIERGEVRPAEQFGTLAELYDTANPTTDADRTLVAAYWFQIVQGAGDVDSQAINAELKHLGHGVGNITRAFDALKSHKPALIMQTRKEGTTKQARKRYKITAEGKKAVERMLAGESEG